MSIRGGYGVFYEHGTGTEANTGSLEGSAPVVLSMERLNQLTPSCLTCGAANTAYPLNVSEIPTKAVWPYVQQWSASIERKLSPYTLATLGYVGSKGTHLTLVRQLNQSRPATDAVNPFGAGTAAVNAHL